MMRCDDCIDDVTTKLSRFVFRCEIGWRSDVCTFQMQIVSCVSAWMQMVLSVDSMSIFACKPLTHVNVSFIRHRSTIQMNERANIYDSDQFKMNKQRMNLQYTCCTSYLNIQRSHNKFVELLSFSYSAKAFSIPNFSIRFRMTHDDFIEFHILKAIHGVVPMCLTSHF